MTSDHRTGPKDRTGGVCAALAALLLATSVAPATAQPGASSEAPSDDGAALRRRARARREAAERALETHRQRRLDERAERTRRLQEAYTLLANARARADRAEAELTRVERRRREAEPDRARASRRAGALARLLGQAADIAPQDRTDEPARFVTSVETKVEGRLQQLDHDTHIHAQSGPVLGRDGRPHPATVWRLGRVTALAVGDPTATGFVRERVDAPPIIVGPTLDDEARRVLHEAKPGRAGRLPLDVDGALTRLEAEPPPSGGQGIRAGGVFIWPILAVGLLGVLLFVERFAYFVLSPVRPERIRRVVAALERGDSAAARASVRPMKTGLDRVLGAGIDAFEAPRKVREHALETALLREEPALERGVALLGAVAGLAPLLGLLGTVTGMIATFDVISTFGTGNPRLLSGGISVALITTQLGLVVAVPALLAHAWVSRAAARRAALLEEARTALLSLPFDADDAPSRGHGP